MYIGFGECSLMGDMNNYNFMPNAKPPTPSKARCYGWDVESYKAGCNVGEEFGCIHYGEKPNATK